MMCLMCSFGWVSSLVNCLLVGFVGSVVKRLVNMVMIFWMGDRVIGLCGGG